MDTSVWLRRIRHKLHIITLHRKLLLKGC